MGFAACGSALFARMTNCKRLPSKVESRFFSKPGRRSARSGWNRALSLPIGRSELVSPREASRPPPPLDVQDQAARRTKSG